MNKLTKFKNGKLRITFKNEKELSELLRFLEGCEFQLVADIHQYIKTALEFDSRMLICEKNCLYTSSEFKANIEYISYQDIFGIEYILPGQEDLMIFLEN